MFKVAGESWSHSDNVPLDAAAAVPYATLGIKIGDDPEQITVLAADNNGDRLWTSSARISLETRQGRIVATSGLEHNLSSYRSDAAFNPDWHSARHLTWIADFADLGLYGVTIHCEDVPAGEDRIEILGQPFDTDRVDENCRSEQLHWSFANTYWVSRSTNRVWRSIQHVHPKGDELQIEFLRPPETPG
ncbi:MAG: YjbF family lipoprotein [Rhizomicrobium sp.]